MSKLLVSIAGSTLFVITACAGIAVGLSTTSALAVGIGAGAAGAAVWHPVFRRGSPFATRRSFGLYCGAIGAFSTLFGGYLVTVAESAAARVAAGATCFHAGSMLVLATFLVLGEHRG